MGQSGDCTSSVSELKREQIVGLYPQDSFLILMAENISEEMREVERNLCTEITSVEKMDPKAGR